MKGCAKAPGHYHPNIDLQAGTQAERAFRRSSSGDLGHFIEGYAMVHAAHVLRAGDRNVEITDGFLLAAKAACDLDISDTFQSPEVYDQGVGDLFGYGHFMWISVLLSRRRSERIFFSVFSPNPACSRIDFFLQPPSDPRRSGCQGPPAECARADVALGKDNLQPAPLSPEFFQDNRGFSFPDVCG
jgi:hypothetical protein